MARKRTRNNEADGTEEDDGRRAPSRTSGNGEKAGKATTKGVVDICFTEAPQARTCSEERLTHEEKTIMLAMVHLLVIASKPTSYPHRHKLVMESLRSIQGFVSSSVLQSQSFVLQGLLAVMPALLAQSEKSIVVRSMALLGGMALNSYQSMMQIANEGVVLYRVLSFLSSADTKVQKEACHTVANLASSIQGQRALCEIGAVEKLMCMLFLVAGLPVNSIGLADTFADKPSKPSRDALLSEILEALDILTRNNFCQRFGGIPEEARISILKGLQMMWKNFRNNHHPLLQEDHICVLSKMIVWLTMEQEIHDESVGDGGENLVRFLFGGNEANFKHFWDDHWEHSPLLMEMGSEVHASLLRTWCAAEGDSFVLKDLLSRTLACPTFSSDTLDATQIFKEIEYNVGKPMIFGQDIRLVKYVHAAATTEQGTMHAAQEFDYHNIGLGANIATGERDVCMYADVQTCVGAYESGYTIALRGLEFRCSQIAEIAEALAICFGQATVGANLYMTPSNSQGFKPHYDDHCVLVWQLTGCKAWKLWAPKVLLPRLYSQEVKSFCKDEEAACVVMLKEGNLLYLPRGFPHAANTETQAQTQATEMHAKSCLQCTQICSKTLLDSITEGSCVRSVNMAHAESRDGSQRQKYALGLPTLQGLDCFSCMQKLQDSQRTIQEDSVPSLHITFGVEVEPPFDWEGFVHMALHCWWTEDQNWEDMTGRRESGGQCQIASNWQSDLCKGLLHVATRQCGDKCSAFRKACLVAARPLRKQTHDTDRFRSFFKVLLQKVAGAAAFKEALDAVLNAIDTPASISLDWMHWLQHLPGKHQASAWIDPVVFFHNRLTIGSSLEGLKDMEVNFTKAKESFVSCGSYTQACDVFVTLLHKYRNARKRFTNGMLALHT